MSKQLYWEFRANCVLRVGALAAAIVINIVLFLLFGKAQVLGFAGHVLSVVISSLTLTGLIVVGVINDVSAIGRLFTAPAAYAAHLAPVKTWRLLLSRMLIQVVQDIIYLFVGVFALLVQVQTMTGVPLFEQIARGMLMSEVHTMIIYGLIAYCTFITVVYFTVTLSRTVFAGMRGRTIISLLGGAVLLEVLNLLNLLLYPLNNGNVYRYGVFMSYTVDPLMSVGAVALIAFKALKCVAVFMATAQLMERKLNIQ